MIEFRRLRPFIQVGLPLVLCGVLVNTALAGLSSTPVLDWLPKRMAGTGYLEDSRLRVQQASDEYNSGHVRADERLGAVIGISNVREGVELRTIADVAGSGWHFLGLAGAGIGVQDVAPFGNLLISSELQPDIVIVGVGLFQLVDFRQQPAAMQPTIVDYVRRGDLRNLATIARDSAWPYARRQDVSLTVQSGVLDLRARLFRVFGVPLPSAEARERSPWREMIRSDWPDHFSSATLREEEEFFQSLGIFDPESYQRSTKSVTTFGTMIGNLQRRGSTVIVVLMPEHPKLQARIPASAFDSTWAQLREKLTTAPRTLDFRRLVPATGFVDLGHLNGAGRAQFSQALALSLHDLLPKESSLMGRRGVHQTGVLPASLEGRAN